MTSLQPHEVSHRRWPRDLADSPTAGEPQPSRLPLNPSYFGAFGASVLPVSHLKVTACSFHVQGACPHLNYLLSATSSCCSDPLCRCQNYARSVGTQPRPSSAVIRVPAAGGLWGPYLALPKASTIWVLTWHQRDHPQEVWG